MNSTWINASGFGASGSTFEAHGRMECGSNELILDNIGDFRTGQTVTVEKCFFHTWGILYNEHKPYLAKNQAALKDELEIEGLDNAKNHQIFVIHFFEANVFSWMVIDPKYQTEMRTQPDIWKFWSWQGKNIPVSDEWIDLVEGVRIRFHKKDWKKSESISFHVRNRLRARILEIHDNTLVLDKKANRSCAAACVRHEDNAALQTALDEAIRTCKPLYIPAGRYRLTDGLRIRNASVRIEGADRVHTILDVSETNTACFWIAGGREVIIRNMAMEGHTGYMELQTNGGWQTAGGSIFWPTANQQMEVGGCAAINAVSTEYMLFEDLDITKMASEAIYLHGSDRSGRAPFIQREHEGMPELSRQYQKTCIINRCNGYNSGFNLFNNNDFAENTIITNCHGEKLGNFCENAAVFCRFTNNYANDCHTLSICSRGLAIVQDNVFEGGTRGGGLYACGGQTIISNNIFRNYSKASPIMAIGSGPITITGNMIDLTHDEGNPNNTREGIAVSAESVIVSDNHIINRGSPDDDTTGILIEDKADNVNLHDNIVSNCRTGFYFGRREWDDAKQQWIRHDSERVGRSIRLRDNMFIQCRKEMAGAEQGLEH